MRKRFLAAACAAALVFAAAFSGCTNTADVKSVKKLGEVFNISENYSYEVREVGDLNGWTCENFYENVVIANKTETNTETGARTINRRAYNFSDGSVFDFPAITESASGERSDKFGALNVYSYGAANCVDNKRFYAYEVNVTGGFISSEGDKIAAQSLDKMPLCVVFFDAAGNNFYNVYKPDYQRYYINGIGAHITRGDGYFIVCDNGFKVKENGELVKNEKYTPLVSTPYYNETFVSGGYIAKISGDKIYVYDESFIARLVYKAPESAIGTFMAAQSNGTAVVQYKTVVGAESNDYEIVENSVKYKLHTGIVSFKDGEFRKKNVGFILKNTDNAAISGAAAWKEKYAGGVLNVAELYPVRNKRVCYGEKVFAVLDNELNVKCRVNGFANGADGFPEYLGNGRFAVADELNGKSFVIDAEGKVVFEVFTADFSRLKTDGKYFYNDDAKTVSVIEGGELKTVEDDAEWVRFYRGGVVVRRSKDYCFYGDNGGKVLKTNFNRFYDDVFVGFLTGGDKQIAELYDGGGNGVLKAESIEVLSYGSFIRAICTDNGAKKSVILSAQGDVLSETGENIFLLETIDGNGLFVCERNASGELENCARMVKVRAKEGK